MALQTDIVVNGKRALVNQLLIGLVTPIFLVLAAMWAFGADFSTMKLQTETNKTNIAELREELRALNLISIDIATIKADVGHVKTDLAEVKNRLP